MSNRQIYSLVECVLKKCPFMLIRSGSMGGLCLNMPLNVSTKMQQSNKKKTRKTGLVLKILKLRSIESLNFALDLEGL